MLFDLAFYNAADAVFFLLVQINVWRMIGVVIFFCW